jgi:AcrR family transcriptional regulator
MAAPQQVGEASPRAGEDAAPRHERADARRNRARILEAAQAVFASQGLSVPIDDVARAAGVGVGTLYRHFPTKDALFEAIVVDGVQRLIDTADSLADADDPTAALFEFIGVMIASGARSKALLEAIASTGFDVKATKAVHSAALRQAMDHLLRRAQQSGGVRADVATADLKALIAGTCQAANSYGGQVDSLYRIVCDGLRAAPTGSPLPR